MPKNEHDELGFFNKQNLFFLWLKHFLPFYSIDVSWEVKSSLLQTNDFELQKAEKVQMQCENFWSKVYSIFKVKNALSYHFLSLPKTFYQFTESRSVI